MKIQKRTEKGKKVRDFNTVPGILYGKGLEATSITANAAEFNKMYRAMGSSKTFEVDLDGVKHLVYIKEVQPLPSDLHSARHFDIVKVALDDTMTSKVRVIFVNKEDVEGRGLILNTVMDSIEIEYAVGKGISYINLDVEGLQENNTLHVSDLAAPEGVKILSSIESVVVSVSRPKEEVIEEEEETIEEEIVEVEAIKQKEE
jgi:large subunit ribosomal protein L25